MSNRPIFGALAESAAGEWLAILSLVFGGCCSNVWALEAVLKSYPSSGTFLTFAQFIYVAVQTFGSQLVWTKGRWTPIWRRNVVPIKRWMVQVVLFFAVSLMNNYAFGLKIPVTVHIIFRSGGLCVSMLTGYFLGRKRYSPGQIFAGVIITVGIVLATISAPRPPRKMSTVASTTDTEAEYFSENVQYVAGIGLLSLALFLSAWLGLWQESTYRQYGNQWREALFYNHFLSLPFFLPMYASLSRTFNAYISSPPITLFAVPTPDVALFPHVDDAKRQLFRWRDVAVPGAVFALGVNVITQGLCIRGVNRLTSRVSSTTVNLILTVRKAVSLALSVWYYGSGWSWGLIVGGAMVLGGTLVYSTAAPPRVEPSKKEKEKDAVELDDRGNESDTNSVSTAVNVRTNGVGSAPDALRQR
ncbi:hypothetical protein CcaverHIS002_0503610 [Cutaneotrichosporon cavernicola]|uniref:UAA transporter n=1 Tax=Cutaneotrichosporon cavernicola TaxID=279322 RepID=A0AA48QWW9_9TREE|nr:uncharacterized protein CcaverHIS019_0504180 [Cutaneotrichosporon cavernicola]BEI84960.1 hypothetical protein CcaverHIS002_0503610 [Cutaneotrichosporon cavernicola]BEI92790.1 hypothetical protein CcaverHIS019_0504180 [Cutaneotrichosporon cavernicola]